jgi:hypothetical protein
MQALDFAAVAWHDLSGEGEMGALQHFLIRIRLSNA